MNVRLAIPNLITLGNLSLGFIAVILAFDGRLTFALIAILCAAVLDFFDGAAARLLNAKSPIGAQLDSLSDLVSFGVAPACMMFVWLDTLHSWEYWLSLDHYWLPNSASPREMLEYAGMDSIWELRQRVPTTGPNWRAMAVSVLIPVFGAIRLARFNVTPQEDADFRGLAIPAAGILLASIPLVGASYFDACDMARNEGLYVGVTAFVGILMVSNLRLFSLKVREFTFGKYAVELLFILMGVAAVVLSVLIKNLWLSIPIIVVLYLILSLIKNALRK